MADLWTRLKRRKLVQWALAYVAFAFALLQGVDIVSQQFAWPDAVQRGITLALILGFFVTLVLAWYHGDQGRQRASGTELLLIALVLGFGGTFMWWVAGTSHSPAHATPSTSAPATARTTADTPSPTTSAIPDKSIAVLPFQNLSDDKNNVYFADGLSEEILNSLARIDGLKVIGRTSSFQFNGKAVDSRTIGKRLGVAYLLEGSVRREGERARVTAQLIRASDGTQQWSQSYDRTVKDSLAVQLDIAEKVAGVLNVVLDDRQRQHMRDAGVKNVDAFIAYQKGWKLYTEAHFDPKVGLLDGLRRANVDFDKAIALDPAFSFAYFAKADYYEHILLTDGISHTERVAAQRDVLKTLERAAATSPDTQQRELALAERQMLSDDWHGLADRIRIALKQPGCSAPNWMPVFASAFGYGDQIENLGARVNVCDPLNAINYNTRITAALATGHPRRALAVRLAMDKAMDVAPMPNWDKIIADLMQGKVKQAQTTLTSLDPSRFGFNRVALLVSRATGKDPPKIDAHLQNTYRKRAKYKMWDISDVTEAALSGDRAKADRLAARLDARPAGGLLLALVVTDCYCGAPFDLKATPHFKTLLSESGLRWPPPQTIKFPNRYPEKPGR